LLPHAIDRIEALGATPLLIGAQAADLYFTPLLVAPPDASGPASRAGASFKLPNAAQSETRSHGFFYKADADGGFLGLPFIHSGGQRQGKWRPFGQTSSGVVFLRYARPDGREAFGKLSETGVLAAAEGEINDNCIASCVDWYGNSRPLFIANRLFALMGYEIVEGRIENDRLQEIRRVDFYRQLAKGSGDG
jgi:hypothetical protein